MDAWRNTHALTRDVLSLCWSTKIFLLTDFEFTKGNKAIFKRLVFIDVAVPSLSLYIDYEYNHTAKEERDYIKLLRFLYSEVRWGSVSRRHGRE